MEDIEFLKLFIISVGIFLSGIFIGPHAQFDRSKNDILSEKLERAEKINMKNEFTGIKALKRLKREGFIFTENSLILYPNKLEKRMYTFKINGIELRYMYKNDEVLRNNDVNTKQLNYEEIIKYINIDVNEKDFINIFEEKMENNKKKII